MRLGPPHLTLNLPCLFVCSSSFVVFALFILFCFVLVGWVVFVILVSACEQNVVYPAIMVFFGCNAGSKHVFPILFLDLAFCCVFSCFLKLACFLHCLLAKETQ